MALKFYASVRIDIRSKEKIKDGDKPIGHKSVAKVIKNKVASPYKSAFFETIYGKGIPRESYLLDMAEENGIVQKSGTWYLYKEDRLGQGRDNAKAFLTGSPRIMDELDKVLREKLLSGTLINNDGSSNEDQKPSD